jgi:Tfp pilus assembly protein PilF
VLLCCSCQESGEWEEAAKLYHVAYTLQPDSERVLTNYALFLYRYGGMASRPKPLDVTEP